MRKTFLCVLVSLFALAAFGQRPVTQGSTTVKGTLVVTGNIEGRTFTLSGNNLQTLLDAKANVNSTPWAAPGPIGATSANTGKFTTLNFINQLQANGVPFGFSHLNGNPSMTQLCPNGTPSSTTFLRGDCQWVSLSDLLANGLGDPGTNGIMKRTALNTTAPATQADVQALLGAGGIRTTEASTAIKTEPVSVTIMAPANNDTVLMFDSSVAVTFTKFRCQISSGTNVVVKVQRVPWDFQTNTPLDMLSTYTATANSVDTVFSSGVVPANNAVMLVVSSVGGIVNNLWCRAEYTKDGGQ